MQNEHEAGVIIESGAQHWQVFQQNTTGTADIYLEGRWLADVACRSAIVLVRLTDESTNDVVTQSLQWQPAETRADGTWSATLASVPCGGLYRIETILRVDNCAVEWSRRGDIVHHIGVGDIWLITGQSNAAGYGKAPVNDGPELGIHMFHANGQWQIASHPLGDSTGTLYPANREGGNPSHSPWLAFARRLKAALGYPIGLIPASLGGSPVSAWDRAVDGCLFVNMLNYVRDSGGSVRGVLWYQGESDANPGAFGLYAERFTRFVADLRQSFANESLPVLTVQLNRWVDASGRGNASSWDAIREVQRQMAGCIPGVYLAPTADLGLADEIHNNSSANLVIGERLAKVALGGVYGRDVEWHFPDCTLARQVAPDQVELLFDHVGIRLNYENSYREDYPFLIRDSAGDVQVVALSLPAANKIVLKLSRPLEDGATVIGVPGCNPPMVIPFDIDGYRPILAFTMAIEPGA